jgi:hypothetical protein
MSRREPRHSRRPSAGGAAAGWPRRRWPYGAALVALGGGVAAAVIAAVLLLPGGGKEPDEPPTAVIVDQLSLTFPNPDFVERVTALFEQDGYAVDYVPGEAVTVEFYRTLAEQGYDYVLLRVHSAQLQDLWRGRYHDEAVLFSSDQYSPELYRDEQWDLELTWAYTGRGAPEYFSITANFIERAMAGNFAGATVVMMGCGGLDTERTAQAFVRRGAGAVVGWDGFVSADHTDEATALLIEKLLVDELPVSTAVDETMGEVGLDPAYGSALLRYPPEG